MKDPIESVTNGVILHLPDDKEGTERKKNVVHNRKEGKKQSFSRSHLRGSHKE